jgi:hypothetical protein
MAYASLIYKNLTLFGRNFDVLPNSFQSSTNIHIIVLVVQSCDPVWDFKPNTFYLPSTLFIHKTESF